MVPLQGAACTSGATLATYIGLGAAGCEIDGLTFFNFGWIPTGANPQSPAGGLQTNQATLTTLINGNGVGFLLTPTVAWGSGGGGFTDGELRFVVKTTNNVPSITGLYQQIDGTATGTGSFVDVLENYCFGNTGLPPCSPIFALESKIAPGAVCGPGSSDGVGGCKNSVNFAATAAISLRKDIRGDSTAGATGANTTITGVINQFTAPVPEPGTYLLSFIGLGLLFLGKRKISRS